MPPLSSESMPRQMNCPDGWSYLSFSFVTSTGGRGGFLASVRDMGVVQPPGINVSADDAVRGGAGGSFFFLGGGTKPASVDPSPASTVPPHRVAAKIGSITVFFIILFRSFGAFLRIFSTTCQPFNFLNFLEAVHVSLATCLDVLVERGHLPCRNALTSALTSAAERGRDQAMNEETGPHQARPPASLLPMILRGSRQAASTVPTALPSR